jgi:SAM-dependent methyltransferase
MMFATGPTSVTTNCLTLDLDWRWHRPKPRQSTPRGEPRADERPIRCSFAGEPVSAAADALPFDDGSFGRVECGAILAYVRNDIGLASELTRVLAPGGLLNMRVPAAGPLAGLDAFNLHRYLVDTTHRGLRPFETAEIGWRRHYGETDLCLLFPERDYELINRRREAIALAEIVRLAGFIAFRWLRPSRDRYRQVAHRARQVESAERKLGVPFGFWLEVSFRRHQPNAAQ